MSNRQAFKLTNAFSGATATLQQQEELKRLREEIEQLKTERDKFKQERVDLLCQELENLSGQQLIDIESMRPSLQARRTFTTATIQKRAESLKRHGQRTPVILVPIMNEDGLFNIEDGELRWRAAKELVNRGFSEWKKLKAVIAPPVTEQEDLHQRSLIHNLHREDLNPLDRIEAILKQIIFKVSIPLSRKELEECSDDKQQALERKIKRIIRNLDYRFKKNQVERVKFLRLLEASPEQQTEELNQWHLDEVQRQIIQVFLELQLNLSSVAANDLPMLMLFPDLKKAIRHSGLPCRHALVIAKLSSEQLKCEESQAIEQRKIATTKVIQNSLSLKKTRVLVNSMLDLQPSSSIDSSSSQISKDKQIKSFFETLSFEGLNSQELFNIKETLAQKIREIENLIHSS